MRGEKGECILVGRVVCGVGELFVPHDLAIPEAFFGIWLLFPSLTKELVALSPPHDHSL